MNQHSKHAQVIAMLCGGVTPTEVSRKLAMPRSTVCSIASRNHVDYEPSTIYQRLDQLHLVMDRIIAQKPPTLKE